MRVTVPAAVKIVDLQEAGGRRPRQSQCLLGLGMPGWTGAGKGHRGSRAIPVSLDGLTDKKVKAVSEEPTEWLKYCFRGVRF